MLKFVQTYYKMSLKLIITDLSFDFENEIENIFKLLDTETLNTLKKSCVYPGFLFFDILQKFYEKM